MQGGKRAFSYSLFAVMLGIGLQEQAARGVTSTYKQLISAASMIDTRYARAGSPSGDYYYGNVAGFLVSQLGWEFGLGSVPANAQVTRANMAVGIVLSSGGG